MTRRDRVLTAGVWAGAGWAAGAALLTGVHWHLTRWYRPGYDLLAQTIGDSRPARTRAVLNDCALWPVHMAVGAYDELRLRYEQRTP